MNKDFDPLLPAATTRQSATSSQIFARIAATIGACVAIGGDAVLFGWIFKIAVLESIVSGWPKMAAAAALGFIVGGTALWCAAKASNSIHQSEQPKWRLLARICAAAMATLGFLKLGDYWPGWNLNFDTLGFHESANVPAATALNFLLLGGALLLAGNSRHFKVFQSLTLVAALISWLGVARYLFGGEPLVFYAQMSAHSALLFLALSVGVLCTRTDSGLMALLASRNAGGLMALWLLLLVPPIPIVIDLLEQKSEQMGWFGAASTAPLISVLDVILLTALIWFAGAWLQRVDTKRVLKEEALRDSDAELRAAQRIARIGNWHLELATGVVSWSEEIYRVFGRDPGLPPPDYVEHRQFLTAASFERMHAAIENTKRTGIPYEVDLELPRTDGNIKWITARGEVARHENGQIVALRGTAQDISERRLMEDRVAYLNRVYAVLSGINTLIVRVRDRDELFREACRVAVEKGNFHIAWIGIVDRSVMKIAPIALAGGNGEFLTAIKDKLSLSESAPLGNNMAAQAIREKRAVVLNNLQCDPKVGFGKQHAEFGCLSMVMLPLIVTDKAVGVLALCASEIEFFHEEELKLLTELAGDIAFAIHHIEKEEKLNYLAYYDEVTGLANRSLFHNRLSHSLQVRGGEQPLVAMVLLDLERFRRVNETLGRASGDELLREVGSRLHRANDTAAHIGTDMFGLILRGAHTPAEINRALEAIVLACFTEPFAIKGEELRVASRAGIALYPGDGADADALLRNAEAALRGSKRSGNRIVFYAPEMNARVAEALAIETRLRRAIERHEFVLHYQPKMSLANGRIIGAEALIRWQDPDKGLIPPGLFIPMLEETGMIVEVGRWVVQQAFADLRAWAAQGLITPRIAVNVSAIQLQRKDFVDSIIEEIERGGDKPEWLELEITESLVMRNVEDSTRKLSALRGMGVTIAIDDFGTGYSSLSYLGRLPIDTLKIDQSFVFGMTGGGDAASIVSTIIALAHGLKLKVVAEGVETEEQLNALKLLGCDEAQGYLFSKPLPAEEIGNLLKLS